MFCAQLLGHAIVMSRRHAFPSNNAHEDDHKQGMAMFKLE
jgi:hypothetical protein